MKASSFASINGLGRPALAVPTFSHRGGGVAYVSRLLREALTDAAARQPRSYELLNSGTHDMSTRRSLTFGLRVLRDSIWRRSDWIVFSHLGISQAQHFIPLQMRLPFVVQLHGVEAWEDDIPAVVREARVRLAPSHFTARRCLASHPELHPITVCPHGLLAETTEQSGTPDRALLSLVTERSALIIGRMVSTERRKGHDQLLECWPAVIAAVPNAQLIIVGEGDDQTRLQRKARELGIGGAVLFTGFVSDATRKALLDRVGVMAMPSRQEGFGIVYLEAMQAGLPCIGAIEDGASEPIVHGVTGLLVEQSDARELSNAVISILSNNEQRRALGDAGRERFATEFTFERYRQRLLATLSEPFGI